MSSPNLLARSPVRPAAPTAVVAGWEVSARRAATALRIIDATPLAKVQLRAPEDGATAATIGVGHGRAARDEGRLVVGAGPGEWLVLAPPGTQADVAEELSQRCADDEFCSVVDLTHGRCLLRLSGARAPATLEKICGIDLADDATPHGAAFRSSVARVVTDVVRDDVDEEPSYLLHCERSSGQYLFDALVDAGGEFDIDVDGFTTPGI